MTTLTPRKSAFSLNRVQIEIFIASSIATDVHLPLLAGDIRQAARKTRRFVYSLPGFVFGPMERTERLHVSKNDEVGTILSTAWVMIPTYTQH